MQGICLQDCRPQPCPRCSAPPCLALPYPALPHPDLALPHPVLPGPAPRMPHSALPCPGLPCTFELMSSTKPGPARSTCCIVHSSCLPLSQIGQEYQVEGFLVKPFKTYHTVPSQASFDLINLALVSSALQIITIAFSKLSDSYVFLRSMTLLDCMSCSNCT